MENGSKSFLKLFVIKRVAENQATKVASVLSSLFLLLSLVASSLRSMLTALSRSVYVFDVLYGIFCLKMAKLGTLNLFFPTIKR